MVKIYKQPFAHDGDAIAIPDASQSDGKMSSADGWTPDYQLPKTDPNYKPVGRQEMNGVFKEITEAIGDIQLSGIAKWSADAAPYPAGAVVWSSNAAWVSTSVNNNSVPGSGGWRPINAEATETIQGLVRLATTAEARALTNDTRALTPKKLADVLGTSLIGQDGYFTVPVVVGGVRRMMFIQWIWKTTLDTQGSPSNWPIAFPTSCLWAQVFCANGSTPLSVSTGEKTTTAVTAYASDLPVTIGLIGIGY